MYINLCICQLIYNKCGLTELIFHNYQKYYRILDNTDTRLNANHSRLQPVLQ